MTPLGFVQKLCAWFAVAVAVTGAGVQARQTLASDMVLRVRLTTGVSTKTANVGDVVEATVVYRPPSLSPGTATVGQNPGRNELPNGMRVRGRVEGVTRADRTRRVRAELRLRFVEVDTGSPPALHTDTHLLLIPGRRYSVMNDVVTVNDAPRGDLAEPLLFGSPLGAGLGLLIGRNGKTAALGALAGFGWLYLRPLIHTTGDMFADVELAPGLPMVLRSR